jgi:hypothetical protein
MPECGGKPCTHTNFLLLGNHACALCKCELHGLGGIFFSEQSIKYRNICHHQASHVLGRPTHYPVAIATTATTQAAMATQGVGAPKMLQALIPKLLPLQAKLLLPPAKLLPPKLPVHPKVLLPKLLPLKLPLRQNKQKKWPLKIKISRLLFGNI